MAMGQSVPVDSSVEVPYSQMTLGICVRLKAEANSNIHNKSLFSPREGSHIICRKMDGTENTHIKRVKPASERHVCLLLFDVPSCPPILTICLLCFSPCHFIGVSSYHGQGRGL